MSGSGGLLDGYYSQLGQLRSVTDGWRTMPGPVRPLSETTNELTQGAPTWADAWEHNKAAYQDWAEKQRVAGVAAGEIDPETGWPTPAGARSAATSAAMGLVMGSAAPEFQAPRIANPLRAYHGSPHEFAPTERNQLGEFDPAKVGTGEGAQMYGVGAGYLAENEGIARNYRDQLSGNLSPADNARYTELSDQHADQRKRLSDLHDLVTYHSINRGQPVDPNWGELGVEPHPEVMKLFQPKIDKAAAEADATKAEMDRILAAPRDSGHMYEAEVHIDPEHMLHWDLPLSQQSKYVQERLSPENLGLKWAGPFPGSGYHGWVDANGKPAGGSLWKTSEPQPLFKADQTGEDIYRRLHDDKAVVSERLRDAGIPALRYADANSRGLVPGWQAHVASLEDDIARNEKGLAAAADHPAVAARWEAKLAATRQELADVKASKPEVKHNFVVFDPKHIDIVRRYGIGALIGGGAAAGAAQGGE